MPKAMAKKSLKKKSSNNHKIRNHNKTKSTKKALNINKERDEELKNLEKVLFGNAADIFSKTFSGDDSDSDEADSSSNIKSVEKQPAWVDDNDEVTYGEVAKSRNLKISLDKGYKKVVEEKYLQIMGKPKWAEKAFTKSERDSDLLKRCGNLLKKSSALEKDKIEFKKLKDLNVETYTEGPIIKVIKFHPTSTVAFIGGVSGVLSIVQVDGKENIKLQSVKFQNFDIACGSLSKQNEEFLVGSQNFRYFYNYNLMTGQSFKVENSHLTDISGMKNFKVSPDDKIIAVCAKNGKILLLSAVTKELIGSLKMSGNVTALNFNSDGSKMFSHGDEGEVYIWDINTRKCIKKFIDDGCLTGTSINVSPNNQFIACGSSSGVVNLYDYESVLTSELIQPSKIFYNLVTQVNSLNFNSTSEILAMSSSYKDSAIKLVHCPSMTVFSNFPPFQCNISKTACVEFSPNSGYFSIGDNKRHAHLYRLKYYGNY